MVLFLGYWGFIYLRSCILTLSSASGPILYDLPTKGGILRIRAESVQVSLDRNFVHFSKVTVAHEDGSILGSVDDATVQGAIPESLTGYHPPIVSEVSGVSLNVVRLRDGTLDFEKYLPARTETTSEIPYSVRLVNGVREPIRITLVDRMSEKSWVAKGLVRSLTLQGEGQRWIAGTSAIVDGIGAANLELRKDPDSGLSIDGAALGLNIVPIFSHLVDLPAFSRYALLRSFSASSLVVRGPVRLFMPNDGRARFEADVQARTTDFAYKDEFVARSAEFTGVITGAGLEGTLAAKSGDVTVNYTGGFSWGSETAVGGSLQATVADSKTAPKVLQRLLPSNITFRNGRFSGWLSYSHAGNIAISGSAKAAQASVASEQLDAPDLNLTASPDRVALNILSAKWQGSPVHGALNFSPKTRGLEGLIVAKSVPIGPLAAKAGMNHLSGETDVEALLTGTGEHPDIDLRITGDGRANVEGHDVNLGQIEAAADFRGGVLNLQRLSVHGPSGVLTAEGAWTQQTSALNIDLVGNGFPLAILGNDMTGSAAFVGKLRGPASRPNGYGRLEIYDAQFRDQAIPLAIADVTADSRTFDAKNIQAFQGATRLRGEVALDIADGALNGRGQLDGISLSDELKGNVAGTVEVTDATIGGTLKHVRIAGKVDGKNIVADGVRVNSVAGQFVLDGNNATGSGDLVLDRGTVNASGTYDLDSRIGNFTGKGAGLDLAELGAILPPGTNLGGGLAGAFSASLAKGAIASLTTTGHLDNVAVNGVPLGSGSFDFQDQTGIWAGSLTVGDVERYLDIEKISYDRAQDTLHAELAAHSLTLGNLLASARPYIAADTDPTAKKEAAKLVLPSETLAQLSGVEGNVDTIATIDGSLHNPTVSIPTLALSDLTVQGRSSGTVQANATLQNGVWDIPALSWTGGPGNVSVAGKIDEHGDANLKGSVSSVDPQWLSLFEPDVAKFTARPNLTFGVTGPAKSPVIDSNLTYLEGGAQSPNRTELAVSTTIREGQIFSTGTYVYKGLDGKLSANIPFHYPFTIPKNEPLTAEITLPARTLNDASAFLSGVDFAKSSGTLEGDVKIGGTVNKLTATGTALLNASTLAATNSDTYLKDVAAKATFGGASLDVSASAKGSNGGTVSFTGGKLTFDNLADVFTQSVDSLLQGSVAGQLDVENFHLVQKSASTDALLNGNVGVSGQMRAPNVKGVVRLLQGTVSIPNAPTSGTANLEPPVNPHFDVSLSMPNSINVKAGLGQFQLTGSGSLGGTLGLPSLNAQLIVDKGTIHLPNARINIDPGGTIQVSYKANPYGIPLEQADVDVTGSTALTANPYGNIIQRYDIDLQVRGDLLSPKPLDITAQSNPPDLDQDRILMLLGQGGIFIQQSLANTEPIRADQQLQQVAYTAISGLLGGATDQLATGLSLDYLDLEYNPFEGVTVTAAKSFSRNLILSARREISQPLPGQLLAWDVRLSYRLPLRGKIYRNLNLFLETNQLYPYEIGLQYGFRF